MVSGVSTERFTPASPPKTNTIAVKKEASSPMTSLATSLVEYFHDNSEATRETFVRVIFGTFMGSLVVLLILLYAGVPIV